MNNLTTSKEGILCLEKDGNLIAIVRKDLSSRKNIIYKVEEMGLEEIEALFNNK